MQAPREPMETLMKNSHARSEMTAKSAVLKLLSDDEIAKLSQQEGGPMLAEGEEYIHLENIHGGVRRIQEKHPVKMGEILPRGAVREATWSAICALVAATTPMN
jgi:hypothetical protein